LELFQQTFDRVAGVASVRRRDLTWRSTYRVNVRMVDRLRDGRVLLAGDLVGDAEHVQTQDSVTGPCVDGPRPRGLPTSSGASITVVYSYRFHRNSNQRLLTGLVTALQPFGLATGTAGFNLDCHAIRHHGDDALLERHYVPKRSQRTTVRN
jgi:hypothetical protein